MAVSTAQIATTPSVYQTSPASAINVMSGSYAAANSQMVTAAVPSVTATVRTDLQGAQQAAALVAANANNGASINAILANPQPQIQLPPQIQSSSQQNQTQQQQTQQQQQQQQTQQQQQQQQQNNSLNGENRGFFGSPT
jgi:hypothetical protein